MAAVSGYSNELCGRLIDSGYTVKGAFTGNTCKFSSPDRIGEFINLSISKNSSSKKYLENIDDATKLVTEILNNMGAKYFGIIVTLPTAGSYNLSNIWVPKENQSEVVEEKPKAENEESKSEAPVQDNS